MSAQTPDGVPCRHCSDPIYWADFCWVHSNGWADCGVVMSGGESPSDLPEGEAKDVMTLLEAVVSPDRVTVDPIITGTLPIPTRAVPVGEWS